MIKDILERMGYKPDGNGSEWLRMKALYRKSDSPSLAVHSKTGWYEDFVTGQSGPFVRLVMMTLDIGEQEAKSYLHGSFLGKTPIEVEVEAPKNCGVKIEKYFDEDSIANLLPSYGFYQKRGISVDVLKTFDSGVRTYGKLNNRFVFPIYDFNKKIIGLAGRELFENSERAKWKILGRKKDFIYPHHLTGEEIGKTNSVVLVESIGDGLALYEAGIRNFLVTFGTAISKQIILYLIRQSVEKIVISMNNDIQSEENHGLIAAEKIKQNLEKFFSSNCIIIKLPFKKDFGDMNSQEIREWSAAI